MNELFEGKLDSSHAVLAIDELGIIQNELRSFTPDEVVWDVFGLKATPPWGIKISEHITDLHMPREASLCWRPDLDTA